MPWLDHQGTSKHRFGFDQSDDTIADPLRIERRSKLQMGAQWIHIARFRVCAIQNGRNDAKVELRLCKHAINALVSNTCLNFHDLCEAWIRCIAQ